LATWFDGLLVCKNIVFIDFKFTCWLWFSEFITTNELAREPNEPARAS
jgi:hypothetical protein